MSQPCDLLYFSSWIQIFRRNFFWVSVLFIFRDGCAKHGPRKRLPVFIEQVLASFIKQISLLQKIDWSRASRENCAVTVVLNDHRWRRGFAGLSRADHYTYADRFEYELSAALPASKLLAFFMTWSTSVQIGSRGSV